MGMGVIGLLLAVLIGISLGLLGGGGSILTVPVLVYVLGFGAKEAVTTSLVVVGVASLFGAVGHWRQGDVNLRIALTFGAIATVGAYAGARLAVFFSGSAQLLLLAGVMLAAASFMFRERSAAGAEKGSAGGFSVGLAALGAGVGILTGLVGVGGGFLIVPALVLLGGMAMREAVGTSLPVISINAAAGFVGHLGNVDVRWSFVALFTAAAVAGIFGGTHLAGYVPQGILRKSFAVFLVAVGIFVVYQNRGALPVV